MYGRVFSENSVGMPKKNSTRKYSRGEIGSVYDTLDEIMSNSSGLTNRIKRLEQLLDWAQKRRTHVLFGNTGASASSSSNVYRLRNADDMVSTIQRHLNTLKPVSNHASPLEAARAASPSRASPRTTRRASSNSAMALQLQLEEIPQMRVVDLKEALRTAGQSVSGKKAELVARYSEFLVKNSK